MRLRHEGERDVTVITQDAVLATFDRILRALTLAVGGIAAISLAVAGILIMNVMLIAVTQRRREIGLLKALGATGRQIRLTFFTEAVLLALGGAAVGLAVGQAAASSSSASCTRRFPSRRRGGRWWPRRSPRSSPRCCSRVAPARTRRAGSTRCRRCRATIGTTRSCCSPISSLHHHVAGRAPPAHRRSPRSASRSASRR